MGEGVHNRPGNVGVAGGVGARCAVGHLTAAGGAALDRQESLSDIVPAGVPLDTAADNGVLRLEYQAVLGL